MNKIEWRWKPFQKLSLEELYAILKARQEVFVVEQNIAYVDNDERDKDAWHLFGMQDGEVVAYLRVLMPGIRYEEHSIGRVLTTKKARGLGVGKELTQMALDRIHETFGPVPIRISAQSYLECFYQDFGFRTVSSPYTEEGILHIEMLRPQ